MRDTKESQPSQQGEVCKSRMKHPPATPQVSEALVPERSQHGSDWESNSPGCAQAFLLGGSTVKVSNEDWKTVEPGVHICCTEQ